MGIYSIWQFNSLPLEVFFKTWLLQIQAKVSQRGAEVGLYCLKAGNFANGKGQRERVFGWQFTAVEIQKYLSHGVKQWAVTRFRIANFEMRIEWTKSGLGT